MKVTLLTKTENMESNLWLIWQLSRGQESLGKIRNQLLEKADLNKFFERIINEDIPLAEMIDFIFVLEDIPISLREQLVRHRIGVKVAGQEFCDLVPDLADSSFWSQSMRVLDMSNFEYFVPESVQKGTDPYGIYAKHMLNTRITYSKLVAAGIPREDARNIIPLGAAHRIVWKLNLAAIRHIMSKRGCWILQLGLWRPVIEGMVNELCKFNPVFRQLVTPPCMRGDEFHGCLFCENNYARIEGDVDPLPPCPLFLNHYHEEALDCSNEVFPESTTCWFWQSDTNKWTCCAENQMPLKEKMRVDYGKLWQRNVDTGEKI